MVFSLSIHGSYRCRHAGACCASGWPIPIEADRLAAIRAAVATGALTSPRGASDASLFTSPDDAPNDTPALLGVKDHMCVFFDAEHGRLCAVQQTLGHDALPLACRQFPRVCAARPAGRLGDALALLPHRGLAAGLAGSRRHRAQRAGLSSRCGVLGLDATAALPPLLRRDVLMDWESWWHWEALAVDLLANGDGSPEETLARLDVAVDDVARWRPADGPLIDRVGDAVARARLLERARVAPFFRLARRAPAAGTQRRAG